MTSSEDLRAAVRAARRIALRELEPRLLASRSVDALLESGCVRAVRVRADLEGSSALDERGGDLALLEAEADAHQGTRVVAPLGAPGANCGTLVVVLASDAPPDAGAQLAELAGDLGVALGERPRSHDGERAASERLLAVALRASPVATVVARIHDGYVLDCNDALTRLLDTTREACIGLDAAGLGLEVTPARSVFFRAELAAGRSFEERDVAFVTHTGRRGVVDVYARPFDRAGTPCSVVAMHDVTAIHEAARAQRASEARFRQVYERAAVGMAMGDETSQTIQHVNPALAELLGFTREEVVGRSWLEFTLPEDAEATRAGLDRLARGEIATLHVDKRYVRKDGGIVWGATSVSRMPMLDGDGFTLLAIIRDITARKEAEARLSEAEERQRLALDAAELGTWRLDARTGMVSLDERAQVHFGLDARVVPFGALRATLHSDDEFALDAALSAASHPEAGAHVVVELRALAAGREARWLSLHVRIRFVRDGSGRPLFALATSRDITEAKATEDALHERLALREQLASIATTVPGSLFTVRRDAYGELELLYVSASGTNTYGLELGTDTLAAMEQLLARIHPDDLARMLPGIADAARSPVPLRHEYRYQHPTRGEIWLQSAACAVAEPDGGTLFHGLTTDVSERVRPDEALRTSEERYRTLVDHLDDIVFSTDRAGVITFVNSAVRHLGFAPGTLRGRILTELAHREDAPRLQAVLDEIRAEAEAQGAPLRGIADVKMRTLELRLLGAPTRPDAPPPKAHIVRLNVRPLVVDGSVRGTTGVVLDLTRQRETEEQLRVAQRMEAIGRLAGGVAHDFNNLLSVITSYASFAKDGLRAEDPLFADLEEILRASKRAEGLTRQLLAFSRRQVLQPVPIDLRDLVGGMEKMLRRLIGEDVELVVAPSPTLSITKADPGQLEQVVMNLAVNARDAMPDGGRLTLSTADVELDPERAHALELEPGAYVALAVADNGTGMSAEVRARVFEPFFTTKELGKGTGLGLSTVYGIIKQSGGGVELETALGVGTTFRIFLPRHVEPVAASPSHPAVSGVAGGHETILVVEDEPAVRNLIRRILVGAGYRVLLASNGGEALLLCEKHGREIRLVVTDVVMPGMNGRELSERLAVACPGLGTVYMSGYTDDAIARHGVLEAGTHFLPKPFDAQALTSMVRKVLDAR